MGRAVQNQTFTAINSRVDSTAREALKQVDTKAVDKALQKMGMDLKELGPAITAYLRSASEYMTTLSDRMVEKDVKALPAQLEHPSEFYETHFEARDTSRLTLDDGKRLPKDFLNNIEVAAKTGLITKDQAKALHLLFYSESATKVVQQPSQNPIPYKSETSNPPESGEEWDLEGWEDENVISSKKGMSTGGGYDAPSAPPAPPGPPPGAGYGTGYGYGDIHKEADYLHQNFAQDNPAYGWLEAALGYESKYKNVTGNALADLQAMKQLKQQLMAELEGIDATTPEGAKKLYILQQRLGDVQGDEKELLDNIRTMQTKRNEFLEMIKSIMDINAQAVRTISNNIR